MARRLRRRRWSWLLPLVLHGVAGATSILDLQPFCSVSHITVRRDDGVTGTATLIDLAPAVNAWFVLTLEWPSGARDSYHLENPFPATTPTLLSSPPGELRLGFGPQAPPCTLTLGPAGGTPPTLEAARSRQLPYAPLCEQRLYLRSTTSGRASTLERVTDFLRDHVWGGDRVVNWVKREFYQGRFLEEAAPVAGTTTSSVAGALAPLAARLADRQPPLAVEPPDLGIEVDSPGRALLLGRWYDVHGIPAVYFSLMRADAMAADLLARREPNVNPLGQTESAALVYLVAFDLAAYDLHFSLGTEHPRLGWSPRPPAASQDPRLPGPDGIDSAAPLERTGMVSPWETRMTIASFAGGFKREHGAFRYGALAERNHGSHYGFVEQGVLFSRLQPGLATVYTTLVGEVHLESWTDGNPGRLAQLRDARQNGVPLIDFDPVRGSSAPGALVNRWGEGNWSGSADEDLRTVRAGLCLQETELRRFLVFGFFSAATPSAMARLFEAYHCRYAMQLDINALEHTYLALYLDHAGQRTVEHLISGMDVLDRRARAELAPRFLGFPDDRDFFYLTRKPQR